MISKSIIYVILILLCFSFFWEKKLKVKWCDEVKFVNNSKMKMDRFLNKTSLTFIRDTTLRSHAKLHGGACLIQKEILFSNDSLGIEYGFDSETLLIESIDFSENFKGAIFDDVEMGVTTRKDLKAKYEDWISDRILVNLKKNWRVRFAFSNETKKLRSMRVVR